jgi:hypothetical protein
MPQEIWNPNWFYACADCPRRHRGPSGGYFDSQQEDIAKTLQIQWSVCKSYVLLIKFSKASPHLIEDSDQSSSCSALERTWRNITAPSRSPRRQSRKCKENGPRPIWLNRFWCLMINITCGLICLLVFAFVVHRMLKLFGPRHWGKQHLKRRHYEDQEKSKKQSKCCMRTVWSGASDCPVAHQAIWCHTPDCPVHKGTVAQRLVPGGTVERRPPKCPVWHPECPV